MLTQYIKEIHPVLPVKDVVESLRFYVEKLGFSIAFADSPDNPKYAGVRRDGIEIHLQWHDAVAWDTMTSSSLRFVVQHIEGLYKEYQSQEVFHKSTSLLETPWGTKEFAFFDLDMNGLTFYHDL